MYSALRLPNTVVWPRPSAKNSRLARSRQLRREAREIERKEDRSLNLVQFVFDRWKSQCRWICHVGVRGYANPGVLRSIAGVQFVHRKSRVLSEKLELGNVLS